MGALYLASKLEECPIRMRDLINVYDLLLQRAAHKLASETSPSHRRTEFKYTPMSYFGNTFYELKDALVVAEMQILKRLGFQVHVVLPYGTLINYLRVLGLTSREGVCNRAWGYLNDAYACIQLLVDYTRSSCLSLQHANARIRPLFCAYHRQRRHPADNTAPRHWSSLFPGEVLVGALRRGLGRHLECVWIHHAALS